MDPDTTLQEIRRLADEILDRDSPHPDDAIALAQAIQDLDAWLRNRGFLPVSWRTKDRF